MPAEFVVDASGKNTRVPEFLERIGIGAPEVEQDIINCFYSTMQHRVPPERQWQDKVMVICYAYRPVRGHLRRAVLHRQLAHHPVHLTGRLQLLLAAAHRDRSSVSSPI